MSEHNPDNDPSEDIEEIVLTTLKCREDMMCLIFGLKEAHLLKESFNERRILLKKTLYKCYLERIFDSLYIRQWRKELREITLDQILDENYFPGE